MDIMAGVHVCLCYRRPAMVGRDGGKAVGHGLQQNHAKPIVDSWQHKRVASTIEITHIGAVVYDFDVRQLPQQVP